MIKIEKKKLSILIIVIMLASSILTFAGICLYANVNDMAIVKKSEYKEMYAIAEKYAKLNLIQNQVNESFLWNTDEKQQMEEIYKALLSSLGDEYSTYMTAEEYAEWMDYVTGTFTGVGIVFSTNSNGEYEIVNLIKDGPAESAGLKQGDIICKVDGKTYNSLEEVSKALRGEEGTSVKVDYQRNGKTAEVTLVRGVVEEASVFAKTLDDKYGYIRISSFEQNTAEQFKTELSEFETKGMDGIVIDLRNNPGGLVDTGIEIADMLLPEGTITHTEDKKGKKKFYNSDGKCTKLKYVVLVNENTASSSEILAAAIKDNKSGKIIGTRTFGKGIIQNTMKMTDNSALKLTTMQYFSPDNKKIHKVGIEPDVNVELPKDATTDLQLEKALEILKQ